MSIGAWVRADDNTWVRATVEETLSDAGAPPTFEELVARVGPLASGQLASAGEPTVCECSNGPCPACGGAGPSGEWFEGAEVTCDDCGVSLVVASCEPRKGRSTFEVVPDESMLDEPPDEQPSRQETHGGETAQVIDDILMYGPHEPGLTREECGYCAAGLPAYDGMHDGTQGMGMISSSPCRDRAKAKAADPVEKADRVDDVRGFLGVFAEAREELKAAEQDGEPPVVQASQETRRAIAAMTAKWPAEPSGDPGELPSAPVFGADEGTLTQAAHLVEAEACRVCRTAAAQVHAHSECWKFVKLAREIRKLVGKSTP